MKRKHFWILLIALLVLIQLVPANRPETTKNETGDLLSVADLPEDVAKLIRSSCYDCHSNQSHYPWYAYVAPASWLVARDARVGREELNFSDWGTMDKMQKANHLGSIIDEVEEEEMPMAIYTLLHREAKLDSFDRQLIVDWANELGESLF